MQPWMLQGLAVGCLLTAAAAVVHKQPSQATSSRLAASDRSHFEYSGRSPSGSAPGKRPSKLRGLRKDESYASRMRTRLDEDSVIVGGQVNAPGPVFIGPSSTLQSAIEKAGGATPFGALNRVKLTRGNMSTEYNLRTPEGLGIHLQPKDLIEVPQKVLLGH